MTEPQTQPVSEAPGLLFRGRYAIIDRPDGALAIPWAMGMCERCASCGCGEQMEPFVLPPMMAGVVRAKLEGAGLTVRQKAAAVTAAVRRKKG